MSQCQVRADVTTEMPVQPSEEIRVKVQLLATGEVAEPTLRLVLPTGFAQTRGEGHSDSVAISEPLDAMSRGDEQERELVFYMTDGARDVTLLRAEVWSVDASGPATAECEVRRKFGRSEGQVNGQTGGQFRSSDGRVTLTFPQRASSHDLRIEHMPQEVARTQSRGATLAMRFELKASVNGEAPSPVERFDEPVELRVDMTGLIDYSNLA